MLLGFDIGGTSLKAGLVDLTGRIVRSESIPTPDSIIDFRRFSDTLLSRLASGVELVGAGVGCPGVIHPSDTTVEILPGKMNYLEGFKLRDLLGAWLPGAATVCADNDARAALAGEMMFGAARGKRNALMLTLGSGVGGAIALNGVLVRGHRGVAGHIGHLTVDPAGAHCLCGNRGCLETVFSARAFEIEAVAAMQRGCDSLLRRRFGEEPHRITCADVFQCAAEGDVVARAIIERGTKYLGGAIAGLLHVLDPEIVILGGQIAQAGATLLDPVRRDVERRTRGLLGRTVPLLATTAGAHAGIVGAASLALHAARSQRTRP
ncbi:MAG: ROK family protein [Acidobacteriota bacterium]